MKAENFRYHLIKIELILLCCCEFPTKGRNKTHLCFIVGLSSVFCGVYENLYVYNITGILFGVGSASVKKPASLSKLSEYRLVSAFPVQQEVSNNR